MRRLMLSLALTALAVPAIHAQDDYDDIYYNPKKDSQSLTEAKTSKKQKKSNYIADFSAVDVDEYNRRGEFYYESQVDTIGQLVENAEDFVYTQQIQKYYNPTIVVDNADILADLLEDSYGNVDIVINDGTPVFTSIYTGSYGWAPSYYNWCVTPSWSWSWGWGPIRYTCGWGPSWSWSWGWGPSWSYYNPYWGWDPYWGYSWGWGRPSYGWGGPGWGGPRPPHAGPMYGHRSPGASRPASPNGGWTANTRPGGNYNGGGTSKGRPAGYSGTRQNGNMRPNRGIASNKMSSTVPGNRQTATQSVLNGSQIKGGNNRTDRNDRINNSRHVTTSRKGTANGAATDLGSGVGKRQDGVQRGGKVTNNNSVNRGSGNRTYNTQRTTTSTKSTTNSTSTKSSSSSRSYNSGSSRSYNSGSSSRSYNSGSSYSGGSHRSSGGSFGGGGRSSGGGSHGGGGHRR